MPGIMENYKYTLVYNFFQKILILNQATRYKFIRQKLLFYYTFLNLQTSVIIEI